MLDKYKVQILIICFEEVSFDRNQIASLTRLVQVMIDDPRCILPVVSIVSVCTRNKGVIALNYKGIPGALLMHTREREQERARQCEVKGVRYREEGVHYDNHFTSLEKKAPLVEAKGR